MIKNTCLAALAAGTALALPLGAPAEAQAKAQEHTVQTGQTWTVARETTLSRLVVAPGGTLAGANGAEVVVAVDGAGVPVQAGTLSGRIVAAPVQPIAWKAMLGNRDYRVPAALYVHDGAVDAARSVAALWQGGQVSNSSADALRITSAMPGFTGVAIEGKGSYTLNDPVIRLEGNGVDDSIGYGAGIVVQGDAHVTINRPTIVTRGVVRTALFVAGQAVVDVNDARIETYDGTLPKDYKFSILPGEMMEVPYGLGIRGNVRATNVQGTAHVTYRNSHIRAQAWGALATDGEGPTYLTAINSTIEAVESGYGAYANGKAQDVFDACVFRVPDYGLVVGGPGSATFTNGTVVTSGRFGVMMHQGSGGGTVRIEKGSTFVTGQTAILVKGRGTTIEIDAAKLVPGNGVLVQTMENDDPIMREMLNNAPPPPESGAAQARPEFSGKVVATIRNTSLSGDILHAMAGKGGLALTLADTNLTGAVSLAQARPASGAEPTRETFAQVGEVLNTLGFHGDEPLTLALEGHTRWTVTRTSYLTGLDLGQSAQIAAPTGQTLRLIVDGKPVAIAPGRYAGRIELRVEDASPRS